MSTLKQLMPIAALKGRGCCLLLLLLLLILPTITTHAQSTPYRGVSTTGVWLRRGPHISYPHDAGVYEATPLLIEWRNAMGTWLYVRSVNDPSRHGWTMTGYVDVDGLSVMQLPMLEVPDANPEYMANADTEDLRLLYSTPLFSGVDPSMLDVFLRGQAAGRAANAVAKIGDCNTDSDLFLTPISIGRYELGPYDYLSETVNIFSASFGRDSLAARDGFNTASIFDPMWADAAVCEPGETPLSCELRLSNPSIAIIVFGQNDIHALNRQQFEGRLRAIIAEAFEWGVIPVLATFTNSPQNTDNWAQILAFNAIIVRVARDYRVPLINFWLAARSLPGYGIGEDYAHLTTGGDVLRFTGSEAQHGMTLYNLVVLYALDMIRHQVMMG